MEYLTGSRVVQSVTFCTRSSYPKPEEPGTVIFFFKNNRNLMVIVSFWLEWVALMASYILCIAVSCLINFHAAPAGDF